jgi:hypothetical protein
MQPDGLLHSSGGVFRDEPTIFPKRDSPVADIAALPSVLHDLMNMINAT